MPGVSFGMVAKLFESQACHIVRHELMQFLRVISGIWFGLNQRSFERQVWYEGMPFLKVISGL
jgi:hypothetical protein